MRYIGSHSFEFRWQVLLRKIIISFLIAIIALFIGLSITFLIVYNLPGDPVLAHLSKYFTQEEYDAMHSLLGFDQPMIVQYFRFIARLFTRQWGVSPSISRGTLIRDLISVRFSRMIEVLLLPTILGLVLGIILGKIAIFFRKKWIDKTIQVIFSLGISIPIFFLGMVFQYNNFTSLGGLPNVGYKTAGIGDPPFVTGSRLIDSLISGQHYLFWDTVNHYILPGIALTILITMLITRQTRVSAEKRPGEKSVISNTISTGMIFGLIFTFYFLIEASFNLHGISELFIRALQTTDIYTALALTSEIIILFILITFIANIIFSINKSLSITKQNSLEDDSSPLPDNKLNHTEKALETDSKRDLKNELKGFLKELLKNPLLLFGLVLVVIYAFIAIFPLAITPYSLSEANGVYDNWWAPPSPEHPLGTTKFGCDILARLVWGTQDAILFGFGAMLIGLLGGIIFGLIGSTNEWVKTAMMALMIPLLIIPSILLILFTATLFGELYGVLMLIIGILLIPIFTRLIAKPPLQRSNIKFLLRKILAYIPIALALAILFYESIGFLGYSNRLIRISLGNDVSRASDRLYSAPYAFLWPGITISFLIMGFVFLHQGLKHHFQVENKK